MKNYKYSVVIATIGRWQFLEDLLGSLEAQGTKPFDVVVILDNEDRYNKKYVKQFFAKFPELNIRVCFGDFNLAQKRNYGANFAKTENIFFSDDDDIWSAEKAELCIDALQTNLVVTHNFGKFGTTREKNCSLLRKFGDDIRLSTALPGDNAYGGGSSIVAKKSVIDVFPFDARMRYCEDFDWWMRLLNAGISIKFIDRDLVRYRAHSSNMTRKNNLIFRFSFILAYRLLSHSLIGVVLSLKIMIRSLLKLVFKLVSS